MPQISTKELSVDIDDILFIDVYSQLFTLVVLNRAAREEKFRQRLSDFNTEVALISEMSALSLPASRDGELKVLPEHILIQDHGDAGESQVGASNPGGKREKQRGRNKDR